MVKSYVKTNHVATRTLLSEHGVSCAPCVLWTRPSASCDRAVLCWCSYPMSPVARLDCRDSDKQWCYKCDSMVLWVPRQSNDAMSVVRWSSESLGINEVARGKGWALNLISCCCLDSWPQVRRLTTSTFLVIEPESCCRVNVQESVFIYKSLFLRMCVSMFVVLMLLCLLRVNEQCEKHGDL